MLNTILALLPILLFIIVFLMLRQSTAKAALFSLLCAVLVGFVRFSASLQVIYWEGVKGLWSAFTIFTVIAPAILIYELLLKSGMFEHFKNTVERVIRDDLLRVLFIGWTFASFLQSITGFGVPVAVAAPILVGLGLSPVKSVIICILGHAWGGTFGTLAIAWDSLFLQVPGAVGYGGLTLYACLLLWAYNLICGLTICFLFKGKKTRGKDIATVGFISLLQGGGQLLFAGYHANTACFLASALAMGGVFLLNRILYHKSGERAVCSADQPSVGHMIFPFVILTLLVAVCLFLEPVHQVLSGWKVGCWLPDGAGRSLYAPISVLTHSGTLLLGAGLATLLFYRGKGYLDRGATGEAVREAMKKALSSTLPILLLIIMSKVMDGTGQIAVLAQSIAALLGPVYPVVAPFVGILGSFISSSNMSSNVLFAGFQDQVAHVLAVDPGAILAAQTVGGSVGNLVATSNIVLGLTTTGGSGEESRVMRALLPVALGCGLVCGLLTMAFCLY